jgi:RNA polymerase sigma-70 factor (ECF subfamily)
VPNIDDQNRIRIDAEIIKRVTKGDKSAFSELVYEYQNRLRSVLSFYCSSRDEIDEFMQDAFVDAYTHLKQFKLSQPFFPWLRAIALNALKMELRRKGIDKKAGLEYLRRLQMSEAAKEHASEKEEEHLEALDQCLNQLQTNSSKLLREKYGNKRSYSELAGMFKSTENSLRVRVMRIRESLRECIEKRIQTAGDR